jgi:hypothetical protein
MRLPEDPACDDPEDREPHDWRRRDRDLADTEDHERFMLGLDPVGAKPSPTETDEQCDS